MSEVDKFGHHVGLRQELVLKQDVPYPRQQRNEALWLSCLARPVPDLLSSGDKGDVPCDHAYVNPRSQHFLHSPQGCGQSEHDRRPTRNKLDRPSMRSSTESERKVRSQTSAVRPARSSEHCS